MTTEIVKINIDVELDDQFFEDVLVTAFDGGSNFWVDHIKINHPGGAKPSGIPTSMWAAQALNNGGTIQVYPTETIDETYRLDKSMFKDGVTLWTKTNPSSMEIINIGGKFTIDPCNIDASDADTILQLALFRKVVFG